MKYQQDYFLLKKNKPHEVFYTSMAIVVSVVAMVLFCTVPPYPYGQLVFGGSLLGCGIGLSVAKLVKFLL